MEGRGRVDAGLKLAGGLLPLDKILKLYAPLYRKTAGQLSRNFDSYIKEYAKIFMLHDYPLADKVRRFIRLGYLPDGP